MKASFFSLAAMVSAAFAAPVLDTATNVVDNVPVVGQTTNGVVNTAGSTVDNVPVVGGVGQAAGGIASDVKRDIEVELDVSGVIHLLETTVSQVLSITGSINGTLAQVDSGELTKADASTHVIKNIHTLQVTISGVVSQLTGLTGLSFATEEVNRVLDLVFQLIGEVLSTLKQVTITLGLDGLLKSVLQIVISVVGSLLLVVISLVGDVVSIVVPLLKGLLTNLGVAQILTPVLNPLAGLLPGLDNVLDLVL